MKNYKDLKEAILEYRNLVEKKVITATVHTYFYLNVLEIAIALAELYFNSNRKILDSEKYWFEGGYYFNFEFKGDPKGEEVLKLFFEMKNELVASNAL